MATEDDSPHEASRQPTPPHAKETIRTIPYSDIAQGAEEVQIEFKGQLYRLRVTRNGKLILNK